MLAVMRPALLFGPEALKSMLFGKKRFSWLKMLKNSARNCSLICSVILVSFNREISALKKPGPRSEFLPVFPKVPTGCSV